MKEILFAILCFILFIVIVMAILFHKSISHFKKLLKQAVEEHEARKMAEEQEYFKRTSDKNYRKKEETHFDKDYFKTTETADGSNKRQQAQQETTTRHTVKTDSGVTIIDDRTANSKSEKKIFDDNEGEYVEFEEV